MTFFYSECILHHLSLISNCRYAYPDDFLILLSVIS